MVFAKNKNICAFDHFYDVHRELDRQPKKTMRSICHCSSLYFTQHLLLNEKLDAFTNLRFGVHVALLNLNVFYYLLQFRLNLSV